MIHLFSKTPKPQKSPPEYFDTPPPFSSKISPIPMIYRKIQNDKKIRTRLRTQGHKMFSKLSACGEDTPLTLENLLKSDRIKYIRRFEFDPYLCEKSHIKLFGKALRKLKDIVYLNLVIRRLDYVDESNLLAPGMMRLQRMKKLRLELTKIEKLEDEGFIKLAWMYGKLYSMRECEQIIIGMDNISQYASLQFAKYGTKLKLCKKFKKTIQRGTLMVKADTNSIGFEEKLMKKVKCGIHFKDIEFFFSIPRGWLSMSTEVDESAAKNLKMISTQKNLERLYLHFSGNPVTLETIQGLTADFHTFKTIRDFGLEFLNSRMSETEVVLFAQALPE